MSSPPAAVPPAAVPPAAVPLDAVPPAPILPAPPGDLRRPPILFGIAVLLAGALCGLRQMMDWDVYWHLAVGREALRQRSLLPTDIFSHTAHGAPWVYKDLIADVVLYVGYDALGAAWLAAIKIAAAVTIALATFFAVAPRGRTFGRLWFPLGVWHLLSVAYRLNDRPVIFSMALFPVVLTCLERVRLHLRDEDPGALTGALGVTVGVLFLWAQLHREVLVGLVLLVGLAGYATAAWALRRARGGAVGRLWLAALSSWLLCAVNPNGWHLYQTSLNVARSDMLRQYIVEWRQMSLGEMLHILPYAVLLWAAALAIGAWALVVAAAAVRRGRPDPSSVRPWHVAVLVLFVAQTASSARWLPMLTGAAALVVALALADLARWLDRRPDVLQRLPRGLDLLLAVGGLAGLYILFPPFPLGLGPQPGHYPERALDFALAHKLRPAAANTMPYGGYLIWRGYPQLLAEVDGRNDTVYPAAHIIACYEAEHDAAAFARQRARDGADWVLAGTGSWGDSHRFLYTDPAWALVYYSHAGAVFVRRDAYPALRDRALSYVPQLATGASVKDVLARARAAAIDREARSAAAIDREARSAAAIDAYVAELERVAAETPDDVGVSLWLAALYDELGPAFAARRDQVMRELLRRRPDVQDAIRAQ